MEHVDIELTLDDIRLFTSGLDLDEDKDEEIVTRMLETTCRVYMLRCEEEVKVGLEYPILKYISLYHNLFPTNKAISLQFNFVLGHKNAKHLARSVKALLRRRRHGNG